MEDYYFNIQMLSVMKNDEKSTFILVAHQLVCLLITVKRGAKWPSIIIIIYRWNDRRFATEPTIDNLKKTAVNPYGYAT